MLKALWEIFRGRAVVVQKFNRDGRGHIGEIEYVGHTPYYPYAPDNEKDAEDVIIK